MKYLFTALTLSLLLISCKSEFQKGVDEKYESFKSQIEKDSMDPFATIDASFIAENSDDINKKNEAMDWLKKNEAFYKRVDSSEKIKLKEDRIFMNKNISIIQKLNEKADCKYLVQHLLLGNFVKDRDTLAKAIKIFTDSIWLSIPYDSTCTGNVRCAIYFYKKKKDFNLNGSNYWFGIGERVTGEESKVHFLEF